MAHSQAAMNRRQFLTSAACAGAAAALSNLPLVAAEKAPNSAHLPLWRGFNLLEKFTFREGGNPAFQEDDFRRMTDWGFNFARLPMSYRCWVGTDWLQFREEDLKHIDQAVAFGRRHRVHVNINFHRAPGYCVNPPKEPLDLWTDEKALDVCSQHWGVFAKRYKGISNSEVSFDLLNEPPDIKEESYVRVATRLVQAIRSEDPNRLVIADGLRWGREPVHGLVELGVAQSTRGYEPMQISHYKANWVNGSDTWPEPTWPLRPGQKDEVNKQTLKEKGILPWKKLEAKGVGVHVGEWGTFNRTPHKVTLAWMRDCLDLWREAGWGWALWNLRGSFGVMDSDRADVDYETVQGHKLDREMLKVLQAG